MSGRTAVRIRQGPGARAAARRDEERQDDGRVDGDGHEECDADFASRIVEGGEARRELESQRHEADEGIVYSERGDGATTRLWTECE